MSGDVDSPDAFVVEWILHGGDAIVTTGLIDLTFLATSSRTAASTTSKDPSPKHSWNRGWSTLSLP